LDFIKKQQTKMKKSIYFVITAALIFSAGCGENNDGGSVYGVVVDAKTGESVSEASVELGIHKFIGTNYWVNGVEQGEHIYTVIMRTVTGSDGQYEFQEINTVIDGDSHYVKVSTDGYEDNTYMLKIEKGKVANGDILLNPYEGTTVTTNPVTGITTSSAVLSGSRATKYTKDLPTSIGFYYGTSPEPKKSGTKTGGGAPSSYADQTFSANISGLTTNTTYYAQAFASNSMGTIYGNVVSFIPSDYIVIGSLCIQMSDLGSADYTTAAAICSQSRVGGYSNWRLPTIGELTMMYANKVTIGGLEGYYWSSTACSDGHNYANFGTGQTGCNDNSVKYRVRAVRNK
jgi:hypothetical protein